MKRGTLTVLGIWVLGMWAGCAQGPYPAPVGSEITSNVESLTLSAPGPIIQLEAIVTNTVGEDETQLLSNVRVTVQSYSQNALVLIPEGAISTDTASQDTSWSCSSENSSCNDTCSSLSGDDYDTCRANCWAQYCGEEYYAWTSVDEAILPNYVETSTDSRGVARVYMWVRCLPMACGSGDTAYGAYSGCTTTISEGCAGVTTSVVFSTGISSDEVNITTNVQPPTAE